MKYDNQIRRQLFTAAPSNKTTQILLVLAIVGLVSFLAGYMT